jgi:hypothetical protein
VTQEPEVTYCSEIVRSSGYGPTAIDPPEYCENEAVPGEEFCQHHLEAHDPLQGADEAYETARDLALEREDW